MDLLQRWLSHGRRRVLRIGEPDYPALLRRIPDAPQMLYLDGDDTLLWHPQIAIVGSRRATAGGLDNARAFAAALARAGWCVTSGMAAGIDTAAHLGALDVQGPTVAVLGSGIDVPFPAGNARTMARIAEHGLVVSEYPPDHPTQAFQFPRRNRIVAALSLGTLVVEAQQKSGALITARLAAEAGREVFAIPGSIHNPMARGCHRLLRDGAMLVESPEEIVAALAPLANVHADDLRMRLSIPTSPRDALQQTLSGMDADAQCLWRALGHDPTPMETLVTRTGLTAAKLASILLVMELEGRVVSQHGRYTRKSS
ncbi:DNA-processing protein DprA [Lysobacter sp. KIS68-7]|uniref:DNA-processing protein DprA n=1 Tax=Lysobacter sp. KIS68-7 TaxID=2904252 RepID=UPI001E5835FD|nr:DNA-processing protein DprA [Lysobacter sp. KIS68-7]UHQ20311.1 DNA-processing protein DprA [Lysobacter sp. KIS68-7]